MKIGDIIKVFPNGVRRNIGVDEDNILMGIDFKKDLLTTPKDLLRNFVSEKSKEDFNKLIEDFTITSETTNDDLSDYIINSIRKMSNSKLEYDRRLDNASTKSIRGSGYFFEQYTMPFSNITDAQFEDVYKLFVDEFKKDNPVAVTFVSKSDINKTITITNNIKPIKSYSLNTPLSLSYEQKGGGKVSYSSYVTSKRANPLWSHIGRSLFTAFDKAKLNLVFDYGSNQNCITKSTFFYSHEMNEEELKKDEEIKSIIKNSHDVDAFDNNTKRGSMSPNTSKEYIESKQVDEKVFEAQQEVKEVLGTIEDNKIDEEDISKMIDGETQEIKEVADNINENEKTKELKSSVVAKEEVIEEVALSPLEKIMDDLNLVAEKEILALDNAYERKKIEAKELAKKMLNDFKSNISLGGTIQSNLEKINQTYRDNELAISFFGVLVKNEILKSIAKDKVIDTFNNNILVLNKNIVTLKEKHEETITTYSNKIKTLDEQLTAIKNEKEEIDEEFDEYVKDVTPKLEELRAELEVANENLKGYEELKSVSEERNLYIEKLEKKSDLLEKQFLGLQGQLTGYETLKNLSELQGKNISSLERENGSLKNQLDLENKSIAELQKALEDIKKVNLKLEEKLLSYETKIEIADEIKKELRDTVKINRELTKKEEIITKSEKEINYLRPINEKEIGDKLLTAKEYSPEWHRLNLIKIGGVNLQSESWKGVNAKSPELFIQVSNTLNELTKAGLMYKTHEGTFKFKEKAKNIIFENLSMTNEELASEFKKHTYQKPENGNTDSYADSKQTRLRLNK